MSVPEPRAEPVRIILRVETAAWLLLIAVSVLLRVIELGDVPLADAESSAALAAYRDTFPNVYTSDANADSPIVYWAQRIGFGLLGGGELSARLITALAGVLLTLSPLLFRESLGRTRVFFFGLLLTLSPSLLLASRFSAGSVWTLLFAALGLFALSRWWLTGSDQRGSGYAIGAAVAFGVMALLTDSGGPALAVVLVGAGAAAVALTALDAPQTYDLPGSEYLEVVRARLAGFPWLNSALAILAAVIAISTALMTLPSGLSMAGSLLDSFLTGITRPAGDTPLAFPLGISLFYEPWLWAAAFAGLWLIVQRGELTFSDRFLAAWVIGGAAFSLIYRGAAAHHALWLIVPLAGLASSLLDDLLIHVNAPTLWIGGLLDDDAADRSTGWVKWTLALLIVAMLTMAAIHLQVFARALLVTPDGLMNAMVNQLQNTSYAIGLRGFGVTVLTLMSMTALYFTAGSIWGGQLAGQGCALGAMAFGLITSAASGVTAATSFASNPIEPWHIIAAAPDIGMIRQTAYDIALRQTAGAPEVPITVMADEDGIIAWQVRDFERLTFVSEISAATGHGVIILPDFGDEANENLNLGGTYVGQRVIASYTWSPDLMVGLDFLPWWLLKRARVGPQIHEAVVIWVREDIYSSTGVE